MATTKTALITGATSGIGYELAKLFANDGYHLVIVARDLNDLSKTGYDLQKNYGIKVTTLSMDLFDPANAYKIYDEITAKGIEVDILVNDAGQGLYGEFLETDLQAEFDIIHLNISSLVALTKLFGRDMAKRGAGKILNLSSIASKVPGPYHSVYHATKAFVQSFTEAIRYEFEDKGISVTALLPGATGTDFFRKAHMESSKIVQEEKMADPADVAKDGYKALMEGKDMVVSGMKNKIRVSLSGITSDEELAAKMAKQQEPVKPKK